MKQTNPETLIRTEILPPKRAPRFQPLFEIRNSSVADRRWPGELSPTISTPFDVISVSLINEETSARHTPSYPLPGSKIGTSYPIRRLFERRFLFFGIGRPLSLYCDVSWFVAFRRRFRFLFVYYIWYGGWVFFLSLWIFPENVSNHDSIRDSYFLYQLWFIIMRSAIVIKFIVF